MSRWSERRRGSLAVLSAPVTLPTKAQADRLAALLARQGSFCVVVATPTPGVLRAFVEYRADCSPPPFTELIRGHLEANVTAEDPAGTVHDLVALATSSELQQALGAAPRASEVRRTGAAIGKAQEGRAVSRSGWCGGGGVPRSANRALVL